MKTPPTTEPAKVSFAPRHPIEERWMDKEADAVWKKRKKQNKTTMKDSEQEEEDQDEDETLSLIEDPETRRKFSWWRKWADVFKRNNSNSSFTTNTTSSSSIIAPPEVTLDEDEAAEPEYVIPVGTGVVSVIFKQLVLVGFGFMMNLITLVVFLPGLNVPRRAQVLMGMGALLNVIVAWHLVGGVELDVVI